MNRREEYAKLAPLFFESSTFSDTFHSHWSSQVVVPTLCHVVPATDTILRRIGQTRKNRIAIRVLAEFFPILAESEITAGPSLQLDNVTRVVTASAATIEPLCAL